MGHRNHRDVEPLARAMDAKLKARDFESRSWVLVQHDERTQLIFRNAFAVKTFDGWYFVFTEHHRFHLYHESDAFVLNLREAGVEGYQET